MNPYLRKLIDTADTKPETYSKYASLSSCGTCGTLIFCQQEMMTDRRIVADAEPLNQVGEALARSMNLATYRLHGLTRYQMEYRSKWDILSEPCGAMQRSGTEVIVVVQHKCWLTLGSNCRAELMG